MEKAHSKTLLLFLVAAATTASMTMESSAIAGGFEKAVLWSGKWAGVAGAATSSVEGPESLYFNPAGLAGRKGFEISLNFSPTFAQFQGPVLNNSDGAFVSPYRFIPVGGGLLSYGLTKAWAVGVGVFAVAGTDAEFDNVSGYESPFSTFTSQALQAQLTTIDTSIGTALELFPGFKIGAAWRIEHVQAGLEMTYLNQTASPITINDAQISSISATQYNGFRVGLQYNAPDKSWGAGVQYRNAVNFSGTGNATIRTQDATGSQSQTSLTGVGVGSGLPEQLSVGANFRLCEALRAFLQYDFYAFQADSDTQQITINSGGLIPSVPLGFMNMNIGRVGLAWKALKHWTFRAGYAYTSQVTPNTAALPILEAPGTGQTATLGVGTSILKRKLDLDLAFEHAFASGSGEAPAALGSYYTSAWDAHVGVTYRM